MMDDKEFQTLSKLFQKQRDYVKNLISTRDFFKGYCRELLRKNRDLEARIKKLEDTP